MLLVVNVVEAKRIKSPAEAELSAVRSSLVLLTLNVAENPGRTRQEIRRERNCGLKDEINFIIVLTLK